MALDKKGNSTMKLMEKRVNLIKLLFLTLGLQAAVSLGLTTGNWFALVVEVLKRSLKTVLINKEGT